MAGNMMNCPDCGKEISKNAPVCPNCGARLKREGLDNIMYLGAAGIVCIFVIGFFVWFFSSIGGCVSAVMH